MEASSSPASRYQVMKFLLIYYFVQVLNLLLLSDCSYYSYCLALTIRKIRKETKRGENFKVGSYFSYCLAIIVHTVLLLLVLIFFYYFTILLFLLSYYFTISLFLFFLLSCRLERLLLFLPLLSLLCEYDISDWIWAWYFLWWACLLILIVLLFLMSCLLLLL
jgi:hypothetical protein